VSLYESMRTRRGEETTEDSIRAELLSRGERGKWSSLAGWFSRDRLLWLGEPQLRDANRVSQANEPLSASDLDWSVTFWSV
jgi:hypothetical protein